MRLVVSSTDQAFALPAESAVYSVALAGGSLAEGAGGPRGARRSTAATEADARHLAAGGCCSASSSGSACSAGASRCSWGRRRRRRVSAVEPDGEDVPLRFEGVTKAYKDGFVAVRDLSFEVRRGQVLGLLGPNGAGKTTSLRMLMGLIRPTEGRISIFGHAAGPGRAGAVPAGLVRRGHGAAAAPVRPRQPDAVLGRDRPPGRGRAHGGGHRGRRPRQRRSTGRCAATARACASGSRSRRRCSACPTCWCSTSRPTGWTRRRSTRCARCCGPTPRPAAR